MNRQLSQTQNKTFIYSYDGNGNILSKKEYPYTTAEQITAEPTSTADYGYSDTEWKDKLTSYNGGTITYDANGNPLTYRDGMSFSWNGGRQLISLRNTSGTTTYYSYNEDGIRIMKNYGGAIRTRFLLDGTNIVAQEVTNGTSLDYEYFFYDASGSPVGMNYLGNNYLFKKNLQGDIIEIWGTADGSSRSDFRKLVTYTYDAWGNITSMVDTTDNWYRVGTANPFRYRGYYYDNESGLYYLQSRYYDPVTGRFLNEDTVAGSNENAVHFNLFSYCGNSPVNNIDLDGYSFSSIWNKFKEAVRTTIRKVHSFFRQRIDTAKFGAIFLQMRADKDGIYHAYFDCWQQYFGYNDMYDFMFDIGTYMKSAKYPFTCNKTNYIIWMWKGDYINLGAGAEIGIYQGGEYQNFHWYVNKSLKMKMTMVLTYNGKKIINYTETTWWLTGFNPNYTNININKLSVKFTVIFNSHQMYLAFKDKYDTSRYRSFLSFNNMYKRVIFSL